MLFAFFYKNNTPLRGEADMDQQIVEAIENRRMITFDYKGYFRKAEPHVYGIKDGTDQVLVYQVSGGRASGRTPVWRLMAVGSIIGTRSTEGKLFRI